MIIVDTNVISELMKPPETRSARVFRWVGSVSEGELASTSLTYAESLYCVERLPDGRRKQAIRSIVSVAFASYFGDRLFPFDKEAAEEYAMLLADRERSGRPILEHDAQIAAVARVRRAAVATRDSDLQNCGVTVINPWEYAGS